VRQAYNDWLIEEWAEQASGLFPNASRAFSRGSGGREIKRRRQRPQGRYLPGNPMELRDVPHINDSVYDPIWAVCQDLDVPLCFHSGASDHPGASHAGYSEDIANALRPLPGRSARLQSW
jgi:predicted TIM-barrel fold metal-dependent hydrolase